MRLIAGISYQKDACIVRVKKMPYRKEHDFASN